MPAAGGQPKRAGIVGRVTSRQGPEASRRGGTYRRRDTAAILYYVARSQCRPALSPEFVFERVSRSPARTLGAGSRAVRANTPCCRSNRRTLVPP